MRMPRWPTNGHARSKNQMAISLGWRPLFVRQDAFTRLQPLLKKDDCETPNIRRSG